MVKGLDILLKNLSEQECPSWRELRDLGRENDSLLEREEGEK